MRLSNKVRVIVTASKVVTYKQEILFSDELIIKIIKKEAGVDNVDEILKDKELVKQMLRESSTFLDHIDDEMNFEVIKSSGFQYDDFEFVEDENDNDE